MALFRRSFPSTSSKWLGLVAAIWIQAISGNNYTFSNYSAALKSLMNLTQVQLNGLSVAKDVGKAFGLLAGLASDRFPTWVILLIGSVEGLLGYGVQWLVVSQRIEPLAYWQMCVFLCMGGNSTTWMNTAVLVISMRNFRNNRGSVSGILKGFVGLSTAIFTNLSSALFSNDPASFLLMLAIIPCGVCLTGIIFLHETPHSSTAAEENEESKYFRIFNTIAVVIAVYLLAIDFIPNSRSPLISRLFAIGLLVLLASPLGVPLFSYLNNRYSIRYDPSGYTAGQATEPMLEEANLAEGTAGEEMPALMETTAVAEEVKRRPVIGEEHTIFEALRAMDFWILFMSFLFGVGTGLTVMNNLGQIGYALGYDDVPVLVSLTSIFGFFGRIFSGSVSEHFIKRAATPRPLWNAASQILMAVGYITMGMAVPGSLYVGSVIVGFCYGIRLAITVPTASELFGLKCYALVYNILILNLPLGSFLFSGLLSGFLYDREATTAAEGGTSCFGAHCYRVVFQVMTAACLIGFCLDILLSIRTKNVYADISTSKDSNNPTSASTIAR